jgi:hypothetical protein
MHARMAKLANVLLITVISGCATSGPPPASAPPTAAPVSFDGNYRGMIRLTSSGVIGTESKWCETPPVISLSVRNNAFSYVLVHPDLPRDSIFSLSPTFTVAIAPDGSFDAISQNGEAEMAGHITGSDIAAQINGSICGYAFTAKTSWEIEQRLNALFAPLLLSKSNPIRAGFFFVILNFD